MTRIRGGPVRHRGLPVLAGSATVVGGAAQMVFAVTATEIGYPLMQRSGALVCVRRGFMSHSGPFGRHAGRSTGSLKDLARDPYLLSTRAPRLTDVGVSLLAPPRQLVHAFLEFSTPTAGRHAVLATVGGILAHTGQRSFGSSQLGGCRLPRHHQASGGRGLRPYDPEQREGEACATGCVQPCTPSLWASRGNALHGERSAW
ncbi:hypothetical protein AB0368_24010 [Actinoplanes sp. NPDC051475]|uniref:hypothetical protein n=1 Tax=Actinoplanes sp. NPDC051475 TaxID=3157225 RepID=UPI00344BC90B